MVRKSKNKVSGAWLTAIPSPNLGTLLSNETIRTCIGLRLGTKICQPHVGKCGSPVNSLGRHGLSCTICASSIPRHLDLNKIFQQGFSSINVSSKLEPDGMFRGDGKRLDGITNTPWSKGRALVWDVTCVDTLAKSYTKNKNLKPGHASETAAKKKHNLYKEIKRNYEFVALAMETIGPWAEETLDFIQNIGKKLNSISGDKRSRYFFIQRLSLAIQRGNYHAMISTLPTTKGLDEIFYL